MIDIKGMVNKLEEDGKPTSEERDLLIRSLLLQAKLHNQQGAIALGLLFTSAAQEIEALQAENVELKKRSEWISVDDELPNKDGNYLTYEKDRVHSSDFCVCWFSGKFGFDLIGTTHWKLLEPPKGE